MARVVDACIFIEPRGLHQSTACGEAQFVPNCRQLWGPFAYPRTCALHAVCCCADGHGTSFTHTCICLRRLAQGGLLSGGSCQLLLLVLGLCRFLHLSLVHFCSRGRWAVYFSARPGQRITCRYVLPVCACPGRDASSATSILPACIGALLSLLRASLRPTSYQRHGLHSRTTFRWLSGACVNGARAAAFRSCVQRSGLARARCLFGRSAALRAGGCQVLVCAGAACVLRAARAGREGGSREWWSTVCISTRPLCVCPYLLGLGC